MIVNQKPRATYRGGTLINIRASSTPYDGASRSRRMGNKGLIGAGPNSIVSTDLNILRQRSHHAIRNNPYAGGSKETYVGNLVGTGIKPRWRAPEIQELWDAWMLECDAEGINSFYGLQALCVGAQFEGGEVFTRFRIRRSSDGLSVPLQLQTLEAEHLDPGYTELGIGANPKRIIMGIEFDQIGRRSAYHLWRYHPNETGDFKGNQRTRVPAEDIVHLYRQDRPGQIRGIPELSAVIARLYEVDEMQDATLMRQKLAQLFGAFVKRKHVADDGLEIPAFGTNVFQDDGDDPITNIEPGGIHYLSDDEEVTFSAPADAGGNYVGWLRSELLAIARGAGITYEQMTGDLSGVNYSSIRAGLLEFRRRAEAIQSHVIIQMWCRPIASRWLDMAVISGALNIPDYWEPNVKRKLLTIDWIAPRWESVDPLKEVTADLMEVRAGFAPRSEKAAERGWDLNELDEETKRGFESADQNGLVYDSDPRQTNKSGALQQLAQKLTADSDKDEIDDEMVPDSSKDE